MTTLSPTEERLRRAMERARKNRGLTHAALAEQLGVKPPSVTVVLTRKSGRIPQSLLDVLDVLGLELTVRERSHEDRLGPSAEEADSPL